MISQPQISWVAKNPNKSQLQRSSRLINEWKIHMTPLKTVQEFQAMVTKFVESPAYRDPIIFSIGGAVKTENGLLASVRFPVVNGFRKNTGTAAVIMSVLRIAPIGTQNVYLTKRQLQEILFYFAPFENDDKEHSNIVAIKAAQKLYEKKGVDSPGDIVASFIFDEDAPILGVEDATLRLYGRSLGFSSFQNLNRSEILKVLPNVLWKGDVPIDQKMVDTQLLSAAFGGNAFAPDSLDKRPMLRHRINLANLKRVNPEFANARLGGCLDIGNNFQDI